MGRVATLVERARYARTFTDTEAAAQLPTVTQEIRHGIAAPVSRFRRLRAVVLPRSLFPLAGPVADPRWQARHAVGGSAVQDVTGAIAEVRAGHVRQVRRPERRC